MEKFEHRVQHCRQYRSGVIAAFAELYLGQFQIPVAEFIPGEVVQRFAGAAEFIDVEGRIHLGTHLFGPTQNPPVGIGQLVERRQRCRRRAVHQREARRVE